MINLEVLKFIMFMSKQSIRFARRREEEMALVKVKRFSQVTLPPDLRKRFNLAEGDYLEAEAVEDGILLKPVSVVERRKAWDRVFKVMKAVHAKQAPSK